jgi:hypothetical protein
MLIIKFVNDLTGDEVTGNYDWVVIVNGMVVEKGKIEGHHRPEGWRELIRRLINKGREIGNLSSEPITPTTDR